MKHAAFPETLLEFENRFRDEAACWDYLRAMKWPHGFRCPKCDGRRAYFVIERGRDECASCGHQTSVTSGTMFHGTRTPLRTWFRAILEFLSAKHGCSAAHLARVLGLAYDTAWTWLQKIRDSFFRPERESLKGRVEGDETYVGGPEPGKRGRARGEKTILVAGAVEMKPRKGLGRTRLAPVDDASGKSLKPFVATVVKEGSKVCTDAWRGYLGLKIAYRHKIDVIGDPKRASKLFPGVHRVFSLLRRLILGTYHGSWSRKWAALYCEEFTFRFNRRTAFTRTHLFRRALEGALRRAPRIHLLTCEARTANVVPA